MTKKTPIKKTPKTTTTLYKVKAKILGKVFEAEGKTGLEALGNLKVRNVKGMAVITMEVGKARKERVLMPPIANRLFNSQGMTREIALKQVSMLLGL